MGKDNQLVDDLPLPNAKGSNLNSDEDTKDTRAQPVITNIIKQSNNEEFSSDDLPDFSFIATPEKRKRKLLNKSLTVEAINKEIEKQSR